MPAPHPRMHGLTHVPGGPDPIPGLFMPVAGGTFEERVLAQPSLVGYWPMDDASGNAHDASGNSRPLSPVGTPAYGQPGPFPDSVQTSIAVTGTTTGSGSSTPTDDSFVGNYTALNLDTVHGGTGDMTVMFLIYPTAYPATFWGNPTYYGNDTNVAHNTQIRPDGQIFWGVNNTTQVQSGLSVPLAGWTHVACTRDSTGLYIYFNGDLVASGTTGTVFSSASHDFRVGGAGSSGSGGVYYYDGRIAHVALFNLALTQAEIAEIYNGGLDGGAIGSVLTVDSDGNPAWEPLPAVVDSIAKSGSTPLTGDVTLSAGSNVTLTQSGQNIQVAASGGTFDPATATSWWFPLVDSDGTCVLDGTGSLIPTLIPL